MARIALQDVVVVDDLGDLEGPVGGRHQLPRQLDSSARTVWDFGDGDDRKMAYATVLREARTRADLTQWLHADVLVDLWPVLYLPREVRRPWQDRHPVLAARGAGPHVPQV